MPHDARCMARLDARMYVGMAAQIKTGMIVLFPGWLTHQALLGSHVSHNAYIAVVHSSSSARDSA